VCLFRWEPVEVLQFGLVRSNRTETPSAEATRGDVAIEVNCPIDCELSGDCEEAVRPPGALRTWSAGSPLLPGSTLFPLGDPREDIMPR